VARNLTNGEGIHPKRYLAICHLTGGAEVMLELSVSVSRANAMMSDNSGARRVFALMIEEEN
jgi:hypothetical protein